MDGATGGLVLARGPGGAQGAARLMARVAGIPLPEARPARCCAPLAAPGLSEEETATTARLFKALADPHRVRIVNLLVTVGPACVGDLPPLLGLSQPTVSFHLRRLLEAGLVNREQRGVWAHYSVDREALARLATIFGDGR